MDKHYTVSDGTLVLFLWPAEEGGYGVTSPLDPELITQAESIEEAFLMAYDAQEALRESRAKPLKVPKKPRRPRVSIPPSPAPTPTAKLAPASPGSPLRSDAEKAQRPSRRRIRIADK